MNETLVKYLAGLVDADGCISLLYRPIKGGWRLQLHLSLSGAVSIDKHDFIKSLPLSTKLGTTTSRQPENRAKQNVWHVCKRSDLEKLLPRLIKHMVVKGGHFQWCLDMLRNTKNKVLSDKDVSALKAAHYISRRESVRKSKNHPTWAWTAGFLDGDGYYSLRHNKKTGRTVCRMGAVSHKDDRESLDLLHKAFGGSIYNEKDWVRWHRNLGPRDAKFSLPFLAKVANHSHLKKHKIESIIHNIKQRLSKKTPEGEATV